MSPRRLAALALLLTVAGSASAFGPPAICADIQIEGTPCLSDTAEGKGDRQLLASLTRCLADAPSVLARMETIRRASRRLADDHAHATEILAALQTAALEATTNAKGEALAWFDLAYFVGVMDQSRHWPKQAVGQADGINGYAYLKRALDLASKDTALARQLPEMELAAAIMTFPLMQKSDDPKAAAKLESAYRDHLARASKGAADNKPLGQNLKVHRERFTKWLDQKK